MTEPTDSQQQKSQVDSSVQVARISRTGTIVAAVVGAVASIAVAFIAYSAGLDKGEKSAAPVTVTETVLNTVIKTTVGAPSTSIGDGDQGLPDVGPTASGSEVHLADKTPVEGESGVAVGKASVRNKEYSRTVSTATGCIETESFAYNIDSGMRSFHANVGLRDDSRAVPINIAILVDGKPRGGGVSVTVGEIAEMNVDVSGGFRLTVQVEAQYLECDVTAVLIDPVLRP